MQRMMRYGAAAGATLAAMWAGSAPAQVQADGSPAPAMTAKDANDVQQLMAELEALKANYAQEVRRLREIDVQVQAKYQRFVGILKYADYDAREGVTPIAYQDTRKFWVQLEYIW